MHLKRALWLGFIVYLTSFALGSILTIFLGVDLSDPANIPPLAWLASLVSVIVVAGIGAWWYFQDKACKPSLKEGALVGVVFLLIGAALDGLVLIPWLFLGGTLQDILAYYLDPIFWLAVILVIVATAAVGKYLEGARPIVPRTVSRPAVRAAPKKTAKKKSAPKRKTVKRSAPKKKAPKKRSSAKKKR